MAKLFNGAAPLIPVSERDALKKAIYKLDARRKGQLKSLKSDHLPPPCDFKDFNYLF